MDSATMLLTGSSRINEARTEINTILGMVFSLIPPGAITCAGRVIVYTSYYAEWTWEYDPTNGSTATLRRKNGGRIEENEWRPKSKAAVIPHDEVIFFRNYLSEFIDAMVAHLPDLQETLKPFKRAAGDGHIVYELQFRLLSKKQPLGPELVKYRKKTNLNSALSIGTTVFLSIEAESDSDCDSFTVIGHHHEATDEFGLLFEGNTIVVLNSDEDFKSDDKIFRLLETNGWSKFE